MTDRFVLDESSWTDAAGVSLDVLSDAVDRFLERLDVTRKRDEGVVKHADFYQTDLGDGMYLYSVIFEPDCQLKFDRDLAERLRLALDRVKDFDDSGLAEYEAEFSGCVRFAPSVAWAHACCSQRHHVATLPLPLGGVPRGRVLVTVGDVTNEIFFITEETEHLDFFRSVIELENADEAMFEHLAPSAFPALKWADNVWRGLGDFSRPYVNIRQELVRCLGGLSDQGARCFSEYRNRHTDQLTDNLSAKIGIKISDENGNTKKHKPSKRDRTRLYRGVEKVFWWHAKLQPNTDRIYFSYDPPLTESTLPEHGHIIVGLFKHHCI